MRITAAITNNGFERCQIHDKISSISSYWKVRIGYFSFSLGHEKTNRYSIAPAVAMKASANSKLVTTNVL
jgi:hypothetical protein